MVSLKRKKKRYICTHKLPSHFLQTPIIMRLNSNYSFCITFCFLIGGTQIFGQWKKLVLPTIPSLGRFVDGGDVTYCFGYNGNGQYTVAYSSTDKRNWVKGADQLVNFVENKPKVASGDTLIISNPGSFAFTVSTNRGLNWALRFPPDVSTTAIALLNGRLFMSFPNNVVHYSDDLGQTWQKIQNVPLELGSLKLIQSGGQLLFKSSQAIYRSLDRGLTWNPVKTLAANETFVSFQQTKQFLFAAFSQTGTSQLKYLISTDNGSTWTTSVHFPSQTRYVFSDGGLLFCGESETTMSGKTISYSIDNGLTWTNSGRFFNKLSEGLLFDGTNCSFDHGITWELGFYDVLDSSNWPWTSKNHLVMDYFQNCVLRGNDQGLSMKWECKPTNQPQVIIYNRIGDMIVGSTFNNQLITSSDEGHTWMPLTIANGMSLVEVFPNGVFLLQDTSKYYYSYNLGATTAPISMPIARNTLVNFFTTDSSFYVRDTAGDFYFAPYANLSQLYPAQIPNVPGSSNLSFVEYGSSGKHIFAFDRVARSAFKLVNNIWIQCYYDGTTLFPDPGYASLTAVEDEVFMFIGGKILTSIDGGLHWLADDISQISPINQFSTVKLLLTDRFAYFYVQEIHQSSVNVYSKPLFSSIKKTNGFIYHDLNLNGLHDSGEPPKPQMFIQSVPSDLFAISDSVGTFRLPYFPGISNSIEPMLSQYQFVTTQNLEIDTNGTIVQEIGIAEMPNIRDLCIEATATPIFRPGFETQVFLTVRNVGTKAADGTVLLIKDPKVDFVSATPIMPNPVSGDSLFFAIPLMQPGETYQIKLVMRTQTTATVGSFVSIGAQLNPVQDDQNPLNNSSTLREQVRGSYDPNDKAVSPEYLHPDMVADGEDLIYTVRFQNIGNFPASFVRILDTLDARLQVASIRVLAASHPYTYTLHGRNVLDVFFDQINLADSVSNEPASHGFVKFAIKADSTLQLGQRVSNTAHIYFDFNPAVVTNTVTTEIKISSTQEVDNDAITFEITPNPGRDVFRIRLAQTLMEPVQVRVYDTSGRLVTTAAHDTLHDGTALPRWSGASGVYLVQLVTKSGSATRKLRVE
jgi:uncharacterized repeat protein (TIGR01451 family)